MNERKLREEEKLGVLSFSSFARAYGIAHFGKSLFWYASEVLFAYFLTEIGNIEGRHMGLVLATGLISGALADMVVGVLLRRKLSCAVQAAKLQLFGAIVCAGLLILLFLGAFVPIPIRFAYAMISGLGFRLSYALYDMPQNAMISLSTPDTESRTRIASLRLFFSGFAAVVVSSAIGPLLSRDIGLDKTVRFLGLAILLSLVAVLSAALLWKSLSKPSFVTTSGSLPPPLKSLKTMRSLPSDIWVLVLAIFLIAGSFSTFTKFEPYYAAYVLKSAFWGGTVIVAASLGMALSQPFWMLLPFKDDRAKMMIFCAILLIMAAVAFIPTGQNPLWGAGLAFCFGAANGGIGMTLWAAFGDAVSRVAKGGEALAYGLLTAAAKISLAAGGIMIGESLNLLDYRNSQSETLLSLMAWPPAIGGGLLVIVFTFRYRGAKLRNIDAWVSLKN